MARFKALNPQNTGDLRHIVNGFDRRLLDAPRTPVLATHKASYHARCFTRLYGTGEVAQVKRYDRPYSHVKHNVNCTACGLPLPK